MVTDGRDRMPDDGAPRQRDAPRGNGVARGSETPRRNRVRRALRDVGGELARLVVPVECGGCGTPDVVLCPACGARLAGPVRRVEGGAPRLDRLGEGPTWPVYAVADCTGPVREAVVAWKDRDRADLTTAFAPALVRLADELVAQVLAGVGDGQQVWIVPVPSTATARRRRGREPARELARVVATRVARASRGESGRVRLVAALTHVSRVRFGGRDQVGLGVRARAGNRSGTLDVRARFRPILAPGLAPRPRAPSALCVLVDDVLTTGATLAECARAIECRGGVVVAAVVLAATPPPGVRTGSHGASVQAHLQAR